MRGIACGSTTNRRTVSTDPELMKVFREVRGERSSTEILWKEICRRQGHAFERWYPTDPEFAVDLAIHRERPVTIHRECLICGHEEERVVPPPSASTSNIVTFIVSHSVATSDPILTVEAPTNWSPPTTRRQRVHHTKKRRWDTKAKRRMRKRSRARNR